MSQVSEQPSTSAMTTETTSAQSRLAPSKNDSLRLETEQPLKPPRNRHQKSKQVVDMANVDDELDVS